VHTFSECSKKTQIWATIVQHDPIYSRTKLIYIWPLSIIGEGSLYPSEPLKTAGLGPPSLVFDKNGLLRPKGWKGQFPGSRPGPGPFPPPWGYPPSPNRGSGNPPYPFQRTLQKPWPLPVGTPFETLARVPPLDNISRSTKTADDMELMIRLSFCCLWV